MNSHLPQSRYTALFHLLILLLALLIALPVNAQQPSTAKPPVKTREEVEADKLNGQVVQFCKEKKFQEALPLARRALEIREKTLGDSHSLTIVSLINLATVYSELNKHQEAAATYQRLLRIQEKLYSPNDLRICDTLEQLGKQRFLEKTEGDAEDLFKRSLKIRETTQGPEHSGLVPVLNNLIALAQQDGRLEQAVRYYKRVLAIHQKHPPQNRNEEAMTMVTYAVVLRMLDKKEEADEYETRARAIYTSTRSEPKSIMVSGGVLSGAVILKVQPSYPAEAKSALVQGAVRVQVEIDEMGIVTSAKAIDGPPLLRKVSEEAARQWRFRPTYLAGQPIQVRGELTFNFTLQ